MTPTTAGYPQSLGETADGIATCFHAGAVVPADDCNQDESRSLLGQQLLQPQRIPDREDFPVVVEVGEDVDLVAPLGEARRPLLQLRLAVVPAQAARAVVEADERPVCGEDVGLERVNLRPVADHERDAVLAQQRVDVLCEPRRVPELDAVTLLRPVEPRERVREPVVVALERRRQLPEDRAHLRAPEKRRDPLVEADETGVELGEPLDVREVARRLDREQETGRRGALPVRDGRAVRQAVEGVVHLDGVEVLRVVLEPEACGQTAVELLLPARVVPAGAAYADSASASVVHRASVPAAATRERPSRSSSASMNGRGSSKSAIASPASRTRSWAAAMSTARAFFREHTASTRPAARWQSESASEPMIRSRYASPSTFGASRATSDVSVASKLRISIVSFGFTVSSVPFSRAPSPRRAVHSSPLPKSKT